MITTKGLHKLLGSPEPTDYARQLAGIANATPESPSGSLIRAGMNRAQEVLEEIKARPSKNCVDAKQSDCYRLGVIEGLEWFIRLPGEAKQILKNHEDRNV